MPIAEAISNFVSSVTSALAGTSQDVGAALADGSALFQTPSVQAFGIGRECSPTTNDTDYASDYESGPHRKLSEILNVKPSTHALYLQTQSKSCALCGKLALECGCHMQGALMGTPSSQAPEAGTSITAISHDEANLLWRRIVADLDLYDTFGVDTDPEVVAGEWWGAVQDDGVTVGLIWLTPWIKGDNTVIAIGRALLSEYRNQKQPMLRSGVLYGKIKEVYPEARTALGLIYSTNPASLKAILNLRTTRLAGVIPFGNRSLYLFIHHQWDN